MIMLIHMGARVLGLIVGLTGVMGCTTTSNPQPLPPPDINSAFLAIVDGGDGTVTVVGDPGAVSNGETIRVTNPGLASGLGSETGGAVASDGSFSVTLGGVLNDEYRLLAANSTAVTDPLDVIVDPDTGEVIHAPENACMTVSPTYIDFGAVHALEPREHDITISNLDSCPLLVVVSVSLSLEHEGWTTSFDNAIEIQAGTEQVAFDVRFEATENVTLPTSEELLVVKAEHDGITDHEVELITVRATPTEK